MKNSKLLTSKASGLVAAAATLAGLLGVSTSANAAFVAYICDDQACSGGNDTIVTDQGAGDNFPGSGLVGQINAGALSFNGFSIITNVSQSKPAIGSAASPQMDITFQVATTDNLLHSVYIYASDTGFTGAGTYSLTLGGTQGPGSTNSVQGRAFGGTTNNNLDMGNKFASTVVTNSTPFALSASGLLVPSVNPFSLTLGIVITRNTAGTTTGDLNLIKVPEPATLGLLGAGLLGLGMIRRRRVA